MTSRSATRRFRAWHSCPERELLPFRPLSQHRRLDGKPPVQRLLERDSRSGSRSSVHCSDDAPFISADVLEPAPSDPGKGISQKAGGPQSDPPRVPCVGYSGVRAVGTWSWRPSVARCHPPQAADHPWLGCNGDTQRSQSAPCARSTDRAHSSAAERPDLATLARVPGDLWSMRGGPFEPLPPPPPVRSRGCAPPDLGGAAAIVVASARPPPPHLVVPSRAADRAPLARPLGAARDRAADGPRDCRLTHWRPPRKRTQPPTRLSLAMATRGRTQPRHPAAPASEPHSRFPPASLQEPASQ